MSRADIFREALRLERENKALAARLAERDKQWADATAAWLAKDLRLAEAEALLLEAREPVWIVSTLRGASVLQSRDRDRLKSLVTRIDAFLAPDSASGECRHEWFRLSSWPDGQFRCYSCGAWQADQPTAASKS